MGYKVSVIIPVYNVEQYLEQCLESIINQTLQEIEVIIVNDGSTDGSKYIIEKYQKISSNIILIQKENGGLGSARNAGLTRATGEYIYFMDSDDYIDRQALEKLYLISKKNELDILLFSGAVFTDEQEKEGLISNFVYTRTKCLDTIMLGKDLFFETYKEKEYITSVCLRFYNKTFLDGCNRRFNENIIHEDEDFGVLTYLDAKRVKIIKDVYFYRRIRTGSIMMEKKNMQSIEGYLYACKEIKKYFDEHNWNVQEKRLMTQFLSEYILSIVFLFCNGDVSTRLQCKMLMDETRKYLKMIGLHNNLSIENKIVVYLFYINPFLLTSAFDTKHKILNVLKGSKV